MKLKRSKNSWPARQIAEQIDHDLRHAQADREEFLAQIDLFEHLLHVGMVTQSLEIERAAQRQAEQQVFGRGHVAVVVVAIEGLDQPDVTPILQPLAQHSPRLEDPAGEFTTPCRVQRAPEAEPEQIRLQIDEAENFVGAIGELLGFRRHRSPRNRSSRRRDGSSYCPIFALRKRTAADRRPHFRRRRRA